MQAEAAGRYVHSVSDLYAADEVELLLEELRELERPTGDVQDFEIAGSVTGVGVGGGARSPDDTVRSWDSHPHYRRSPPPPPAQVAPLYCFVGHLATPAGALRLAVAACSLCCACLEPSSKPLRATALFSLMASSTLLFLDVSRLVHLFPFNWAKLNAWLYACVGCAYALASSRAMAAQLGEDESIAAACFGLIGGIVSGVTALIYCYRRPSASSSSALLAIPSRSPTGSPSPPPSRRAPCYLPVPSEPDPVPCSSKTPL